MNEEEEANAHIIRKAVLAFQENFSLYVKEMDENLWKRGMDYARTFTSSEDMNLIDDGGQNEQEE